MLDISKLRENTLEELSTRVGKLAREIFETAEKVLANKNKNTSMVRVLCRDMARIKTVIREKEILAGGS